MRIAHFISDDVDPQALRGIPRSVHYTSKYQVQLGHQLAVFCIPSTGKAVVAPDVDVFSYGSPSRPFTLPKGLSKDLQMWKPDVVHMHSVYTPVLAALASWLRHNKIPYVAAPRGGFSPYVIKRRPLLKYPYKYLFELHIMNHAVFVHAVADTEDIRRYGVKSPIVEAPNGIDVSEIPDKLDTALLCRLYPQLRDKRVFIFLGRLDIFQKGLDELLAGFAKANCQDAALVLIGPGKTNDIEHLRKMASDLEIQDQVIFHGPSYGEEKYHLLSGANVFVHPSRVEAGICHAIMESAACYLPAMISRMADPRQLFEKYHGGIYVETDAQDIAHGITTCMQMSDTALTTMGAKARQLIEQELNWMHIAHTIIKGYEKYVPYPNKR